MAKKNKKNTQPKKEVTYKKQEITLMRRLFVPSLVLFGISVCLIAVIILLRVTYIDSLYPEGDIQEEMVSVFARQMETQEFRPLDLIAVELSDGGNGTLISSKTSKKSFNYNSDTYAKLSIEGREGVMVIGRGTWDIPKDVCAHIGSYYTFMGKVSPNYKEKKAEVGSLFNFNAQYSAGYLSTGNFFKQDGFYVITYEVQAAPGNILFASYATSHIRELKSVKEDLKKFVELALRGNATDDGDGLDIGERIYSDTVPIGGMDYNGDAPGGQIGDGSHLTEPVRDWDSIDYTEIDKKLQEDAVGGPENLPQQQPQTNSTDTNEEEISLSVSGNETP